MYFCVVVSTSFYFYSQEDIKKRYFQPIGVKYITFNSIYCARYYLFGPSWQWDCRLELMEYIVNENLIVTEILVSFILRDVIGALPSNRNMS